RRWCLRRRGRDSPLNAEVTAAASFGPSQSIWRDAIAVALSGAKTKTLSRPVRSMMLQTASVAEQSFNLRPDSINCLRRRRSWAMLDELRYVTPPRLRTTLGVAPLIDSRRRV